MKKIISLIISLLLLFIVVTSNISSYSIKASSGSIPNGTDVTQFIGYGYNVAGGKAICDPDALNLNSPILNMENADLKNAIKVFNSSKTTYVSNTSSKVSEIAEEYGQVMSGDVGLSVGASASKAMSGNVDINTSFNTTKNSSWSTTYSEEYSYFNIVAANKPVILQKDSSALKNYLSDSFMTDLKNVHSKKAAEKLYEKYGTHLLTGYILGGIFEMTNYYATDSSSYVRQQETSFSAQVNAAISYMAFSGNANNSFSFTDTYGTSDNNSHAVNNYKCTTYGGYVFPGLTIDQAFSYYETLTDAGYMYKIWTDSINAGNNLVIVEIPQSSKLVPLWDLVPFSNEYDPEVRQYLIDGYMSICEQAYNDFSGKYKDVRALGIPDEDFEIEYGFIEKGYQYFYKNDQNNNYVSTYVNTYDEPSKVHDLISGSTIAMDYDEGEYAGAEVVWSFGSNDKYVEWIDTTTGIFKVKDGINNINNLVLSATVNGNQIVYKKTFNIKKKADFKAGDGSVENPFLITDEDEFLKLSNDGYATGNYHFKLLCDLDFQNIDCVVIGTEDKPFNGVFDGNYYTIYNYKLIYHDAKTNQNKDKYLGLFGYNEGTIKNLTLSERNGGTLSYNNINYQNQYSEINYIGGIAAVNRSKGIIDNCHVVDFSGEIREISDGTVIDKNIPAGENSRIVECLVGGICGINEGKVNSCSIKDSLLFSKGEQDYNNAYCGGIVAKNNNSSSDISINNCLSENSYVFVHLGKINITTSGNAYGSAICGHLIKGIISNCIAVDYSDYSINPPIEGESMIRGIVYGATGIQNINLYLGGIVGKADKNTSIFSCITKNISSIISSSRPTTGKYTINSGMLGGTIDSNTKIEECIVERVLKANSKVEYQYIANNSLDSIQNVEERNVVTWDQLSQSLSSDEWFESESSAQDGKKYPVPYFDYITDLSFDFEEAKIEFLKGEAFKTGNLRINALHANGDLIALNSYIINWNDFVNSFIESNKQFTIFVYCCGVESNYEVLVREPLYINMDASIAEEKIYYIDDIFDINDIKLQLIKENGKFDNFSISNCKVYNKTTNSNELKLVEGVNEITIEYNGLSDSVYVIAEEREIHHIKIVQGKGLTQEDIYVGQTTLNIEDSQIKIYYDKDETIPFTIAPLTDGELIFPELVEGINTILVNYGTYKTVEFTINVKFNTTKYNKVGFIEAVNEIDKVTGLNEKYILIVKANKALAELEDYRDAEILNSIDKLNKHINEYNELASTINKDFDKTVEIGNSIVYTVLYFTSFSLLGILITLLRKRVQ